ncbi:MAG: hypothetical protein ACKO15_05315, partial [Burkholderiales bacterium]
MSLLLDALKRAEDAKRAKAEAAALSATPSKSAAETSPSAQATPAPTPTESLTLVGDVSPPQAGPASAGPDVNAPPEFPGLSLEVVDDRPCDPVAKSSANPVAPSLLHDDALLAEQVLHNSVVAAPRMRLEEMRASELSYSDLDKHASPPLTTNPPATAAARASRLPLAPSPAELLASYSTAPSLEPLVAPKPSTDPSAAISQVESAQQAQNRTAIKNAFAVKQPAKSSGKVKWALPIAGILLVMIGAGGWYVWSEMNRLSKPAARLALSPGINAPETSAAAPS